MARDGFWEHLIELSRQDKVTIFVSTHFMNEAQRCDRISLMNAGKVLVVDTPAGVIKSAARATLEDAFIGYLEDAEAKAGPPSRRRRRQQTRPRRGERAGAARHRRGRDQLLVQPAAHAELQPPRDAGAEPRPHPPDAGRAG